MDKEEFTKLAKKHLFALENYPDKMGKITLSIYGIDKLYEELIIMTKSELKEIVQKATEEVWYNKRSFDPVKEQTELITENLYEALILPVVVKSLPCGDEIWLKAQETDRFLFEEWFDELK